MQIHMLDGSSLSVVDEQIVAARQRQQRSHCWWPARPSRIAVAALLLSAIVVGVLSAEVTFIRHGMSCGNAVSWISCPLAGLATSAMPNRVAHHADCRGGSVALLKGGGAGGTQAGRDGVRGPRRDAHVRAVSEHS
eukprot:COSAG06_NODE_24354_length_665_cov_1.157244_1_plen_136_part_00